MFDVGKNKGYNRNSTNFVALIKNTNLVNFQNFFEFIYFLN